jgi:hypothetical protein
MAKATKASAKKSGSTSKAKKATKGISDKALGSVRGGARLRYK